VGLTVKKYKEEKRRREKAEVEELAAQIAKGKPLSSVAFIREAIRHFNCIVQQEQRYRNDPEVRMERYGAYDYKENFWKDNDYSASLEHDATMKLRKLLRYIKKYHPLTWLEYQEQRKRAR
jgi:hypothetical protein